MCDSTLKEDEMFDLKQFNSSIIGWFNSTAGVDGFYSFGCSQKIPFDGFPVDARLIGIIPISILDTSLVDRTKESLLKRKNMLIYNITKDFEPYYEDGTFHFNDLKIWTSNYDDYDDYDNIKLYKYNYDGIKLH